MTQTCILIGHPVSHSVSPAIHSAAYELLGLDATYELRDAPTHADVLELVEFIRRGEILGANVTVPHKLVALAAADVLHPSAQAIGAANVLCRDEQGRVVARNTDAAGLADELREARSVLSEALGTRRDVLVIGSGGAALASVAAAQMAGFERVWVSARRYHPETPRAEWPLADQLIQMGAELLVWPAYDADALAELQPRLAAIVQATSAGMKGASDGKELAQLLHLEQFEPLVAYDLVYNPSMTPFVEIARACGHHANTGLGMLVGQAAHAIEAWFGQRPPQLPLMEAARKALGL